MGTLDLIYGAITMFWFGFVVGCVAGCLTFGVIAYLSQKVW